MTKSSAKREPAPAGSRLCLCGCGGTTKSTFVPGHDMRYKSQLFAKALLGDVDAVAEVERRGWSEILRAKRVKAQRKADVQRDRKNHSAPPRVRPTTMEPAAALDRLNTMKAAAAKLKELGRYGVTAGPRRIPLTAESARQILDGTHPDLQEGLR